MLQSHWCTTQYVCACVCVLDGSSISQPTKLYQQVTHLTWQIFRLCLSSHWSRCFSLVISLSTPPFPSFENHKTFSASCCLMCLFVFAVSLSLWPISWIRNPYSLVLSFSWPVLLFWFLFSCFSLSNYRSPLSIFFSLVTIHLLLKPRSKTFHSLTPHPVAWHTNHTPNTHTHTHAAVHTACTAVLQSLLNDAISLLKI